MIARKRTPSRYVYYGLHLYFSGLSLRKASERLSQLYKRTHVTIWNWIQKYYPKQISYKRKRISEFIVDEILLKVGSEFMWLWVAIEPQNRQILAVTVTRERNMFVAERFISSIVKIHGKHPVSTDGRTCYPMACMSLRLKHHIHSFLAKEEKSPIERTMQYVKDRIECFDEYFPCSKEKCKLNDIKHWLNLFVKIHNKEVLNA
jgi:putative transposase